MLESIRKRYQQYHGERNTFYQGSRSVLGAGFHFANMAEYQISIGKKDNAELLLRAADNLLQISRESGVVGVDHDRLDDLIEELREKVRQRG